MRWESLFADLESQSEALERAERAGEVDERTRSEFATATLIDRLRAAVGDSIRLACAGAETVAGEVQRVGPDWLLVAEASGGEVLVVRAAVGLVRGVGRASAVPGAAGVESRIGLRQILRGVARDRLPVRIRLRDGTVVEATMDRVGADYVEVAAHPAGEPRRRGDVRESVLVPFEALALVRRVR